MPRTRTPPSLKWALNERAVLLGTLGKLEDRRAAVDQRLTLVRARLAAMDRAILVLADQAKPDALGAIHPHEGRFGPRGAKTAYLRAALREAGTAGVTTSELTLRAMAHLQLEFSTPSDRKRFSRTIGRALLRLWNQGLIEPMHADPRDGTPGRWRLKQETTLEALAEAEREGT